MSDRLDPATGISLHKIAPGREVDFAALGAFVDASWRADYPGNPRFVYDEPYFRWLLGGGDWIGVVARDADRRLVGCVFALFRVLQCGPTRIAAGYGTALTIAPQYRGAGIGKWMVDLQRAHIFEHCERAAAFSVFQAGHGGLKTVDAAGRQRANLGIVNFHRSRIWVRRLAADADKPPAATVHPWARVCCAQGASTLQSAEGPGIAQLPTATEFSELMAAAGNLAFLPTESFARLYLAPEGSRSGTFLYECAGGVCAIAYSMVACAIDDRAVGKVANVQIVCKRGVAEQALSEVLQQLSGELRARGCLSMALLDQGQVSIGFLEAEGFVPNDAEFTLSLRAKSECLDVLERVVLPVSVDFL